MTIEEVQAKNEKAKTPHLYILMERFNDGQKPVLWCRAVVTDAEELKKFLPRNYTLVRYENDEIATVTVIETGGK